MSEGVRFEDAFHELFRLAYRVSYRVLGDQGDAEDIAQEALARTVSRWHKLADRPEGWVVTVATNLAIDRQRRRRRQIGHSPDSLVLVDPYLAERLDLARAIRQLPRRQREVVVLRYLADLSELDVADALGCAPGSVKTHASRGLAALRRQLEVSEDRGGEDVQASR